ncbi:NF-kappa-B inhibitor-like protein 1 isoform X2 [Myotis myotis]|nr:NF-kappa-B inhibitor-like protein 1 isoform X2 [Myotis myotis]XP_036212398.1 NF-kappa-B inhibitor-like protein 1 isoform X2 [Myotis myotis]XP_036212399.1 NF-kappa-B inhibitor-like protein 1 isoform X2 [Myotis myotis]XP_036212400.1 NF-kappa-B inhibitor-like protein 1 isoform X2 [Myotis myotis]XP_036212401.1 NF-kappa-B inhibitor-like protein 1 isoform X2 [Myotis myotis]
MASKARRRRRERRFRRYLSAGRLARAQALLQRHPGLDVDAGRPPPLHRACARHDAPALCLLLRLGADPARRDRHGNTALHAAARRGPGAYTDFFLPLLRRCPSAMGIKNKDGETPGQILGWGPPWDSAEEEEEDEASREHQWRQKLLGELEDEWQEVTGRLEDYEAQEPESFSAWSDRLAREHAQKCQQQRKAKGARRPARTEGSSLSWRRQEEERRLFQERARAKEEELRESRARRAQEQAQEAHRAQPPRGAGRGNLWRFNDVPWPCPGGGDPEAMAAALVARGPPLEEQEALRRALPFSTAVVFIAHDIFPAHLPNPQLYTPVTRTHTAAPALDARGPPAHSQAGPEQAGAPSRLTLSLCRAPLVWERKLRNFPGLCQRLLIPPMTPGGLTTP